MKWDDIKWPITLTTDNINRLSLYYLLHKTGFSGESVEICLRFRNNLSGKEMSRNKLLHFSRCRWPMNTKINELIEYDIYAEVVTRVAGSLEARGLPGYPEVLFVKINVTKSWQSFVALYFTRILKTQGLKLYMKCLHV